MDDILKNLHLALAKGKDDYGVACDAIEEIIRLRTIISDLLNMPEYDGTQAVSEARRRIKRAAVAAISNSDPCYRQGESEDE